MINVLSFCLTMKKKKEKKKNSLILCTFPSVTSMLSLAFVQRHSNEEREMYTKNFFWTEANKKLVEEV